MRAFLAACSTAIALWVLAWPTTALAAHHAHAQPEVHVGIVLFDGVQIIDFAGPYEVFGQAGFGVATVSPNGKPVTTSMGLTVTPDFAFANAPAFDVLLVPGGDVDQASADPAVLDFIRQRSADAGQVLSVCTGAQILAAAGLLDGLKATTFHRALDDLATHYPKVTVVRDQRWVDNGKIITSAGLSSGIDAALHVVARRQSEDAARTTALHLEYDWHPHGGFVRGVLADRYLPKLQTIEWPKDIDFKQLSAVGDERQWRVRHRIKTQTTRDELMQRIARSIAGEGWQREASQTDYRWRHDVDGQRIDLVIATRPVEAADAFELEATLAVGGMRGDE
ncbi:MAG TPA: DJ-1/PfpI family protein [Lysobacter sp.]|nr:DJ-1/PfpI family protein [Lysobacter sp.]